MYKSKLPLFASKEKHVGKKHYLFLHKDFDRSKKFPNLRLTDKTFFLANTLSIYYNMFYSNHQIELKEEPKANAVESPVAKRNLVYRYEDTKPLPEFLSQVWHKHWITIVVAALDFVVILYSIIGIMKVGFNEAAGLFGIGIFVWFCLTWMVVHEHCGAEIHNWLIQPVADWVDNHWKYLKWYVN